MTETSQAWDFLVHTDGASRGNPGKAGIGVVICRPDGEVVREVSEYLGLETNNAAEYRALLRALDEVCHLGAKKVKFFSDSELMVRQINGDYRVKNPNLFPLYEKVKQKIQTLERFAIEHVRREANANADRLANQGIDRHSAEKTTT